MKDYDIDDGGGGAWLIIIIIFPIRLVLRSFY